MCCVAFESSLQCRSVDTCGDWTAGDLSELGHRISKEDKSEEQLDKVLKRGAREGLSAHTWNAGREEGCMLEEHL